MSASGPAVWLTALCTQWPITEAEEGNTETRLNCARGGGGGLAGMVESDLVSWRLVGTGSEGRDKRTGASTTRLKICVEEGGAADGNGACDFGKEGEIDWKAD